MTVTLRLGTPFRDITGGASEVKLNARSVKALCDGMEKKYPGFKKMVFDNKGKIKNYSNIYVNGHDIRGLHELDTPLNNGDVVSVLFALAGG